MTQSGKVVGKVADGFQTVVFLLVLADWLNNGVRQYAEISVSWCSLYTLHHADDIDNYTQCIVG